MCFLLSCFVWYHDCAVFYVIFKTSVNMHLTVLFSGCLKLLACAFYYSFQYASLATYYRPLFFALSLCNLFINLPTLNLGINLL